MVANSATQVGDGRDPQVVRKRVAANDRPNAELIVAASRRRATVVVPSVPFKAGAAAMLEAD